MTFVTLGSYEIDAGDILSSLGVLFSALIALAAVFLNHYYSSRRLKIELENKDKQSLLDVTCSLQESRFNTRMQQMERLFEYTLELKNLYERLRGNLDLIDIWDIETARQFPIKANNIANEIKHLDNKIRVILSVYFDDEFLDIDVLFLADFNIDVTVQAEDFYEYNFYDLVSTDKISDYLSMKKQSFSILLDAFVNDLCNLENTFAEKIESERKKLYRHALDVD